MNRRRDVTSSVSIEAAEGVTGNEIHRGDTVRGRDRQTDRRTDGQKDSNRGRHRERHRGTEREEIMEAGYSKQWRWLSSRMRKETNRQTETYIQTDIQIDKH